MDKLKATIRSAEGVPCGFRATCNPGGAGHAWVKARYIDPGPNRIVTGFSPTPSTARAWSWPASSSPPASPTTRPSWPTIPGYVARLQICGSAEPVRAWFEGDWTITEGAFFDNWSARNILSPFRVPDDWTRFRAF